MTCSIAGCSNINFNGLSECVLHCRKDYYGDNIRNRLLTEFYALMNKYLIDCALEKPVPDINNEIYGCSKLILP